MTRPLDYALRAPLGMTELAYLRTPAAIRERAEKMLAYVEDGKSAWFAFDGNGLEVGGAGDTRRHSQALSQSCRHSLPFTLAAFRGGRPRPLGRARRAAEGIAEGGDRAPPHGPRRRVGPARRRRRPGLVLPRARYRRDLRALRGAGRRELPHVRQWRVQPRRQGRSAARRRRAARRVDADGCRHGLPGEGAQSADRARRPRRACCASWAVSASIDPVRCSTSWRQDPGAAAR